MRYTITINELITRPIIRNDHPEEFLNKMTDDEINVWEKEVDQILIEEGVPKIFPDWNAAILAKSIDMEILYNILKLNHNK